MISFILHHLVHLLNFFSRFYLPFGYDYNRNYRLSDGLIFFPIVGYLVNLSSFVIFIFASFLGFSCFLQSVILLSLHIWFTRALHEDGFCDTIDGLSAFADKEKRLSIMSEPQIGSFAVIGICLQLMLRLGSIMVFVCGFEFLLLFFSWCCGGALAKTAIGLTLKQLPQVKKDGIAKSMIADTKNNDILIMLIIYVFIAFSSSLILSFIWVLLASIIVICFIYLFNRLILKRIGGYNGDVLGCVEQFGQTIFILIISLSI